MALMDSTIVCAADQTPIALATVQVNTENHAAVLRGANFYKIHCMMCHTMKYLSHDPIAKEAGITLDKMPLKNQQWFLNIVPPDLTLIARQRSANWLYTYFHAFYEDKSRPTGFNNLLVHNVNMNNVFLALQGRQILLPRYQSILNDLQPSYHRQYYTLLKLTQSGSMTPEQFDGAMTDLVNFLVYASDPGRPQRFKLGVWVIGFLLVLLVLSWLLKRLYWRDVRN